MRMCIAPCAVAALLVVSVVGLKNRQPLHPSDPFSVYDSLSLLKVNACNASNVDRLSDIIARANCRVLTEPGELVLPLHGGCGSGAVACTPQAATELAKQPSVELLVEGNLGDHLRRKGAASLTKRFRNDITIDFDLQRHGDRFFDHFRDYDDITAQIEKLVNESAGTAELLQLEPATVEGRHLLAVRLRGPDWKPGSPRALFTYLLHAREWISAMAGVYAVGQVIEQARQHPEFLKNMEVVFVPISNPDGFVFSTTQDRFWRKNRAAGPGCNGVDLNRNFDFQWGLFDDPHKPQQHLVCHETYEGPSAASEPETQALQNLMTESPLTVHIDFHSCGGFVLGPWSYTTKAHPRLRQIMDLGMKLREAIRSKKGTRYEFCVGNSCLYPVAGDMPDFSTNSGALGFTIEMRPAVGLFASLEDFAPDEALIQPNAEENFAAVKAALTWASKAK